MRWKDADGAKAMPQAIAGFLLGIENRGFAPIQRRRGDCWLADFCQHRMRCGGCCFELSRRLHGQFTIRVLQRDVNESLPH